MTENSRPGKMMKRYKKGVCLFLLTVMIVTVCMSLKSTGLRANAAGLTNEETDSSKEYQKFSLDSYKLDYIVDSSWTDIFPWNWKEGIGKSVYQMLYEMTNGVWSFSRNVSYLSGYVIEQTYKMDFISDTTTQIADNIRKIAGINSSGKLRSSGLVPTFLPLFILIAGAYFGYLLIFKRKTTEAISFLLTFVVIFTVSFGFIKHSSTYLSMINEFQKELNEEMLDVAGSLLLGNEKNNGDQVSSIRKSLFDVQIKRPWLLLQYGESEISEIGADRVNDLLTATGSERESIVKKEVEDYGNYNLSMQEAGSRFGMVLLVLITNLIISICVFILCAGMIFSQIMFIFYACFFPVAFIFALLPGQSANMGKICYKLFDTLLHKVGVTIILSITFSVSVLCYTITQSTGFFWVMFIQCVIYIYVVMKTRDLLGFMRLSGAEAKKGRRPLNMLSTGIRHMYYRNMKKGLMKIGKGTAGISSASSIAETAVQKKQQTKTPEDKTPQYVKEKDSLNVARKAEYNSHSAEKKKQDLKPGEKQEKMNWGQKNVDWKQTGAVSEKKEKGYVKGAVQKREEDPTKKDPGRVLNNGTGGDMKESSVDPKRQSRGKEDRYSADRTGEQRYNRIYGSHARKSADGKYYVDKENRPQSKYKKSADGFNNITSRAYDYDELERQLIGVDAPVRKSESSEGRRESGRGNAVDRKLNSGTARIRVDAETSDKGRKIYERGRNTKGDQIK